MKWIVLVIVLCLGLYTWLTLHYRKENPAFAPYADMKDRANTTRLLSAGYQRVTVRAERPADPAAIAGGAAVRPAPGGLTEELQATLLDQPVLPDAYPQVTAAGTANGLLPYSVRFACEITEPKNDPGPVSLYMKDNRIVIVPELEQLGGDLQSRGRDRLVQFTLPGGTLKPGHYEVLLIGARASQAWALQVH